MFSPMKALALLTLLTSLFLASCNYNAGGYQPSSYMTDYQKRTSSSQSYSSCCQ